jgi:hypothetical protein
MVGGDHGYFIFANFTILARFLPNKNRKTTVKGQSPTPIVNCIGRKYT